MTQEQKTARIEGLRVPTVFRDERPQKPARAPLARPVQRGLPLWLASLRFFAAGKS